MCRFEDGEEHLIDTSKIKVRAVRAESRATAATNACMYAQAQKQRPPLPSPSLSPILSSQGRRQPQQPQSGPVKVSTVQEPILYLADGRTQVSMPTFLSTSFSLCLYVYFHLSVTGRCLRHKTPSVTVSHSIFSRYMPLHICSYECHVAEFVLTRLIVQIAAHTLAELPKDIAVEQLSPNSQRQYQAWCAQQPWLYSSPAESTLGTDAACDHATSTAAGAVAKKPPQSQRQKQQQKACHVSDEQLLAALEQRSTVSRALQSLGMRTNGSNYARAKQLLAVAGAYAEAEQVEEVEMHGQRKRQQNKKRKKEAVEQRQAKRTSVAPAATNYAVHDVVVVHYVRPPAWFQGTITSIGQYCPQVIPCVLSESVV